MLLVRDISPVCGLSHPKAKIEVNCCLQLSDSQSGDVSAWKSNSRLSSRVSGVVLPGRNRCA